MVKIIKKIRRISLIFILSLSIMFSSCSFHKHNYVEQIITEATCENDGVKLYKCSRCNNTYTETYSKKKYTSSEIYDLVCKSVGEIETYDENNNALSIGTGFMYSKDGLIITNYHVIENAYSAKITLNNAIYQINSVVAYDKDIDLAILQITGTNFDFVDLCYKTHAVGSTIYAVGSSQGFTSTFSQGIISYANREIDGVTYIQHNASLSSGNSGGPLINEYCEIIGINTMTIKDSQNLNFAISVNEISKLTLSTPLSFVEYYEKECRPLIKLKNYVKTNGEYNDETGVYSFEFDSYLKNDCLTIQKITYVSDEDYINLVSIFQDDTSIVSSSIKIKYDPSTTTLYEYTILYITSSSISMVKGYLKANEFTDQTTLSHTSSTNVNSSYALSLLKKIAVSMIDVYLVSFNQLDATIGVTSKDFGFVNY